MRIIKESGKLEQLKQVVNTTWSGDLISKTYTKELRDLGLISSFNGWHIITVEGLKILSGLNIIQP